MVISFYPRNFRGFFLFPYDAAHKSMLDESSIFERDNFLSIITFLHYLSSSSLNGKGFFISLKMEQSHDE